MDTVSISLILLLAVLVSGFALRLSPIALPAPLLQIGMGALLAFGFGFDVRLDPAIFFLLFIPPLLFLDGWRIPKQEFFRNRRTILMLALGLVVFTVTGAGLFVHWLLPVVPLPVAFALAAVLSPTDPIAVSAVAGRTIPPRLMYILEGEALLNDASGLVCLRFAVAAALTGTFSVVEASMSFAKVALGGVLIGFVVTWVAGLLQRRLVRHAGEDTGTQTLLSLMIPFAAYLGAEHAHVSGILAAAIAGITMNYVDGSGAGLGNTRVQRSAVWNMVQFTLNGLIFVLLGAQLPSIIGRLPSTAAEVGVRHGSSLMIDALLIAASLFVLRLLWVWASLELTLARAARRGERRARPSKRLLVVTALAGVRGTITLAGILTLPLTLNDGSPFPARELVVFLSAAVILATLVAASVGLPWLMKGVQLPAEAPDQEKERNAQRKAAEAAIRRIEEAQHGMAEGDDHADVYAEAALHVMNVYRERIDASARKLSERAEDRLRAELERKLRLAGIQAEREVYRHLHDEHAIDDHLFQKLLRALDLLEVSMGGSASHGHG